MRVGSMAALCAVLLFSAGSNLIWAADWNPLPDTGQTKCYDVAGNEITCPTEGQPLHGQDAQYQGAVPAYTDNGDGTVTDNNTGLVWMNNTADTNNDGQVTSDDYPTGDRITWQEAVDYCEGLSFAGLSDWRLPDYAELESIVNYDRYNPAINPVFMCESSYYWSATTIAIDINSAWLINFYDGLDAWTKKTSHAYVHCVRGGL